MPSLTIDGPILFSQEIGKVLTFPCCANQFIFSGEFPGMWHTARCPSVLLVPSFSLLCAFHLWKNMKILWAYLDHATHFYLRFQPLSRLWQVTRIFLSRIPARNLCACSQIFQTTRVWRIFKYFNFSTLHPPKSGFAVMDAPHILLENITILTNRLQYITRIHSSTTPGWASMASGWTPWLQGSLHGSRVSLNGSRVSPMAPG